MEDDKFSMIIVEQFSGRFGNQFLTYNNLRQISSLLNDDWWCPRWSGSDLFENPVENNFQSPEIGFFEQDLLLSDSEIIEKFSRKNVIIDHTMLGKGFFRFSRIESEKFITYGRQTRKNQIGIHFRGSDFRDWNPLSILSTNYYIDSIDFITTEINEPEFVLFTDDLSLKSYYDSKNFLIEKGAKWRTGLSQMTGNYLDDFVDMSQSEYIISSPSTFSISAGIVGKSKMIHSKSWIDHRVEEKDEFWVRLREQENSHMLWREL